MTTSNIVTRNWRDLIRPRGIHIESETLTEFYGKFTAEPLGPDGQVAQRAVCGDHVEGAPVRELRDHHVDQRSQVGFVVLEGGGERLGGSGQEGKVAAGVE